MAKGRLISTSFWDDSKVVDDFTPEDKYIYLYCMTNPHTNLCGCYEVSVKQIASETGYNEDTVKRLLMRLDRDHNVIRYSSITKELGVDDDLEDVAEESAQIERDAIIGLIRHDVLDLEQFFFKSLAPLQDSALLRCSDVPCSH